MDWDVVSFLERVCYEEEDVKVTPEIVEYIVTAITFYHPTAG